MCQHKTQLSNKQSGRGHKRGVYLSPISQECCGRVRQQGGMQSVLLLVIEETAGAQCCALPSTRFPQVQESVTTISTLARSRPLTSNMPAFEKAAALLSWSLKIASDQTIQQSI